MGTHILRRATRSLKDSTGNYIDARGKTGRCCLGVKDLVIVDTPDALLIADRRRAQEVGAYREGTGTAQAGRSA